MCGRITCQLKACTEDQKGTRVGPTKFCCDQVLLRAHTCDFQKKTPFIQGCTQGSKVVWGRPTNSCCEHTHVCVAESHVNSRLAPRIKKVQEFGRPTAAASIHICVSETVPGCTQGSQVTRDWPTTCENMSSQGCTQGPRVTSVWPTMCCCEHTHVCCRIYQFRVAPRVDMLQGFGRPGAAASLHICFAEYFCSTLHARVKRSFAAVSTHTHMCVSEQLNSSLHTKIKRYKGLASQVLL